METRGNRTGDHAKGSLWEHLETHGYDERYFRDHHLSSHRSRRKKAMGIALIVSIMLALALSFALFGKPTGIPTGNFVLDINEGCCEDLCAQTKAADCSGTFHSGTYCREIENCLVGCCIDVEGYCLTNYLKGNCMAKKGEFQKKKCKDNIYCKFGTDKPLVTRDEELRMRRLLNFSTGISAGVAYHGSSMVIRHVVSPIQEIVMVEAILRKNGAAIAVVPLFDDGEHFDGGEDDGIFAQEWNTGEVEIAASDPDTIELSMDVRITKVDGFEILEKTQILTLLNGNFCFPLNYPARAVDKRIAVIGEGYTSYAQYKQDVSYFLGRLFSSGNLSSKIAKTDVYRVDVLDGGDLSSATAHCRWFDNGKDTLIILKRDMVCEKTVGIPAVKVEPRSFLNISISKMDYGTFEGFCNHVKTEQQEIDDMVEQIKGPRAVFTAGHNSTVNSTVANVTFSVVYGFRPVNYEVYVNTLLEEVSEGVFRPKLLASGISNDETPIFVEIPGLWYGEHTVEVLSKWRRWSQRWSSHTLNMTLEANPSPEDGIEVPSG